ncbi:MAG: Conserved rane protein [Myxococcaceae bacterium]|nr:Conserved rane protein [Myxococcaceae bacterium]
MSKRERRDPLVVVLVALATRLGVVAWAASAIPPTADGEYYHRLATRIASGEGYTWLWPDGVVTHAAHYPVGYPAMIAAAYALFGAKPVVAMLVNALVGAAGAWAAFDLLAKATSRKLALAGGLAVALHPALVPYTAALMTEGVTAALLVIATAFAERSHRAAQRRGAIGWFMACGVIMGVATLVRPQSLVLAPVLGWLAMRSSATSGAVRSGSMGAILATMLAVGVCAPWTARNCVRMERCALVSVNGGWNLAIGTQTNGGGWQEMVVPDACKEVFAEAAKDECFGRAARATIASDPMRWLARAPAKLRVTFDYFGAAPWYLHAANPERFPYRAKVVLGTLETIVSRLLLVAALVTARKLDGPRRLSREAVTAVGLVACFLAAGAMGYLACAVALLLLGPRELLRLPRIVPMTAAVLVATAVMHAVFFGAGRYGLVVVPFVTALAFVRPSPSPAAAADDADEAQG